MGTLALHALRAAAYANRPTAKTKNGKRRSLRHALLKLSRTSGFALKCFLSIKFSFANSRVF